MLLDSPNHGLGALASLVAEREKDHASGAHHTEGQPVAAPGTMIFHDHGRVEPANRDGADHSASSR